MLKHKISLWSFQADQLEAFAEYLEQQAQRGWFIDCEKADVIPFPVFKRGIPENRRYSVVMIPNTSEWDTDNDSRIVEYSQICEEYGWEYVGSCRKFRIFSSENQEAVPIETSPDMWFETVGREQLTRTIPVYLLLCILFAVQSSYVFKNPSWNLVDNDMISALAVQVLAGFTMAFLALKSIIWYLKTKIRIHSGRQVKMASLKNVKTSSCVVFAALFLIIISLFGSGEGMKKLILGLMAVIAAFLSLMICGVIHRTIKKKGRGSDKENHAGYFVLSCFFLFLFIGSIEFIVFRLLPGNMNERESVSESDRTFPYDPSPFGYEWDESRYARNESSIMASVQGGAYKKTEGEEVVSTLSISLYTARYNWVYNWLYADMKDDYGAYEITESKTSRMGDMTIDYYKYEISDAAGRDRYVYVVQKGDHILKLNFYMQEDKELVNDVLKQFDGWKW